MTFYRGRHAELYELFYQDKRYDQEAEFVADRLMKFAKTPVQRVLDMACGTGIHAFQLQKKGYEVIGCDISADMIRQATAKAEQTSSGVRFVEQDMRNLGRELGLFDAVICLFDSIGYVVTNEGLQNTFDSVNLVLRPGGLFIFEFWHASAIMKFYEPVRVRRWKVGNNEILRISETALDIPKQTATVRYTVYESQHDGSFAYFEEIQINRYFSVPEMEHWLVCNGLTPLEWSSGYHATEPVTDHTWHIVAVARKT